jgi:hypothetical protein
MSLQVAATAEATKQAALSIANDAAAGIDSLVADVSSSTAALKKEAGSSTKAAGAAMDKMVAAAIAKGQTLKETLAAGKPDVAAQIDAVLGRFVARANELRSQLNSKQMDAGSVLDQVRSRVCVTYRSNMVAKWTGSMLWTSCAADRANGVVCWQPLCKTVRSSHIAACFEFSQLLEGMRADMSSSRGMTVCGVPVGPAGDATAAAPPATSG